MDRTYAVGGAVGVAVSQPEISQELEPLSLDIGRRGWGWPGWWAVWASRGKKAGVDAELNISIV